MKNILALVILLATSTSITFAQGGPVMGRQFDPAKMVAAEKQLLMDSVSGLNNDQKLIINEIYKDYKASFLVARENADPGNREAMRSSMMSIRKEKDEALSAILTEEQFVKFEQLLKDRREKSQQRRRPGND